MENSSHPAIELRDVSFHVNGSGELVQGVSLAIERGETLVLLGRSGSGKTTTIKLINRLLLPTSGEVLVEGRSTRAWDPIRLRRMIGYVIQETGLFPHFTVKRNIATVPNLEQWPKEKIENRVSELMQVVGLDQQLADRYPHQLSGGQRQRVGVARALAADPPILLMDEPFGALDPLTRDELQREFLSLQQRLKKTVVFVTHDLREALLLGSRVGLMETGKLAALATAEQFRQSRDPKIIAYMKAFDTGLDFSPTPEGA